MILDWLAREGWIVLSWWLLTSLAGLAALPLCFSLLRALPDRGYTLARALGLLLSGFIFWLGVSLGFLSNSPGSILLAWTILVAASLALYQHGGRTGGLRAWWRANRRFVLVAELLFLAALLAMAVLRAHNNSLIGTEKPMELAFLSSTLRSEVFPPADPWLSGHAISYYYFGYVLLAMLASLSGIGSTIAFNMGIALLFALGALTAYGVAGNLARSRPGRAGWRSGLLGAACATVLGNWQLPLVELPWQSGAGSNAWFSFWGQHDRLAAKVLASGAQTQVGLPDWSFWWWWKSSRVLTDRNLDGSIVPIDVITEFPAFSFLLADVHPHVLSLPFVLLLTGLALALVLAGRPPDRTWSLLCALVLGGVTFLNTWDGPVSLLLLTCAEGLRRLRGSEQGRLKRVELLATLGFGLRLGLLALLLYVPFYLSFRSQAGGVLPNLQHPTQLRQLFLVFATFIIVLGAWLLLEARRAGPSLNRRLLVGVTVLVPLALVALVTVMALVGSRLPDTANVLRGFLQTGDSMGSLLPALLLRRVSGLPLLLVLCAGIGLVLARLFPAGASRVAPSVPRQQPGALFAALLVGIGLLLLLVPEFVFLRDVFSSRSNTIFKLYYHAWLLFSIAMAWSAGSLQLDAGGRRVRVAMTGLTAFAILPGLLFPVAGVYTRALVESGRLNSVLAPPLGLDGGPGFIGTDDYAAIRCLETVAGDGQPVVAEASGPQYNQYFGRTGTLTGIPVVLNWEGHQQQWRGASWPALRGSRPEDLDRLYRTQTIVEASDIIERYGIDYVFYGDSERRRYGTRGEEKFRDHFGVLCESAESRFYRVAGVSAAELGNS